MITLILFISIVVIGWMFFRSFMNIWSINTLFNTKIPYTFSTLLAAIWIGKLVNDTLRKL